MSDDKKQKSQSPTKLTLGYLRKRGALCHLAEKWVKTKDGGIRKDAFGCIDIFAIVGRDFMGVQATSANNHKLRLDKSIAIPELTSFLRTGNKFQVWSWKKTNLTRKDGTTSSCIRYTPRVTQVELRDGQLVCVKFLLK